jgi:hypothetical protein
MPATEVIGSTESLDELVVDLDETAAAIQTPFRLHHMARTIRSMA